MKLNCNKIKYMRKNERKKRLCPAGFGRQKAVMPLLACVLACSPVGAYSLGQDVSGVSISITKKNISVKEALEQIKRQSGVFLMYQEEAVKGLMLNLDLEGATLQEALDSLCAQAGLTYELSDGHVLIRPKGEDSVQAVQQERKITVRGVVVDEQGNPLTGATIRNPKGGGKQATVADMDGNFILTVPEGVTQLEVAFIGMKPQLVTVHEGRPLHVVMEEDKQQLDEVIVTGYQTLSKERATGSFATVSSEEINRKLQTSLMDRLEGTVAGMTNYRGLQIRGVSTLDGVTTPLYVVDGVPYEGTLAAIHPSEVVNVTVLKDAAAASIYGARAANGVVVITTRSGEAGKTRVRYNGSLKFTPLYDVDYLNLMSSAEFVDFQQKLFNINPGTVSDSRYYMNEVRSLLFANRDGEISDEELERQLDIYRSRDRYDQAVKEFVRKPAITHQHNLSISGGSEKYTYALSVNYMKELPYDKFTDNDRIGINLKNNFKFNKWISADLTVMGSFYRSNTKSGRSGLADLTGRSVPSYLLYYDEEGNEIPWYTASYKSKEEIDRLVGLGLYDETYYPLQEISRGRSKTRSNYFNINANVKFTVNKDLYFNLIFTQDFGTNYSKQLYDEDAHSVRKMVNDAAQVSDDGEITYNIPTGGQVSETRSDNDSYTLRVQGNYNKLFGDKHRIAVIAGAERRATKSKATSMNKVGWDDDMMTFKNIDEKTLASRIEDTEALAGYFQYTAGDAYTYDEDRYVSFYANGSYTFDERATVTASMRIDQSNLFGSDPKYQYRPLWSVGGQYILLKNQNWVDRLSFRMTYGINGNIPRNTGPYLTIASSGINTDINDYQYTVQTPENPGLRWEKTAVFNVGVDFNLFGNRFNGSVEFYNKNTSDLLHTKTLDPTLGWTQLQINYGKMYNRGVEVSLHGVCIATRDFTWSTNATFSYNKNKVTELESNSNSVLDYIDSAQIREGKPMNSMYSVRWAGLDEKGAPQAYKKDGTIVKSITDLTVDDLVYCGTITPPYAASLSNTFRYKNLSCSVLFTYYGGHKMRGVYGQYLINSGYSVNQDKLTGNFWEKPGDEKDPSKAPAYLNQASSNIQNLWKAADKHMQPGDFIKLNQINVAYSLPQSLLKKTFLQDVTVTLQIDDVWKWVANDQDLDPEVWTGGGLTSSRGQKSPATYSLGLSCTF